MVVCSVDSWKVVMFSVAIMVFDSTALTNKNMSWGTLHSMTHTTVCCFNSACLVIVKYNVDI